MNQDNALKSLLSYQVYDDQTLISLGENKFINLGKAPPGHLFELYDKEKKKKEPDKAFLNYFEKNKEKIKERLKRKEPEIEFILSFCKKEIFPSKRAANNELKRIKSQKSKHKKPVRSYECERCGWWHLTSLSIEEWQKKINANARTEETFITSEQIKERLTKLQASILQKAEG